MYFFEDKTSIYNNEYTKDGRDIKVKIGVVNNNDILKAIKNGDSDCLSRLLEYSKNDSGLVNTSFKYAGSITKYTSIKDLYKNWTNGGYYYVYTEYDNENGKYTTIEDVSLYMCINTSNVWLLSDYLSSNFKWNLNGDSTNSGSSIKTESIAPVKLPNAGKITGIIGFISIVVVGGIVYNLKKIIEYRDV